MKLIKEEKLLFGLPIKIKNLGTIYQPTLKDYIDNNINIEDFRGIFGLKIDLLVDNSEGLKNFDFFILQIMQNKKGALYITQLIKYLKILYKTDNVELINTKEEDLNSIGILVKKDNEEFFINRENYDGLTEVISIMLYNGNNIKEKEIKEELNEIDLKIAKRKREFEKRKAEKEKRQNKDNEALTILDLVNYIIHTDNSQYDYNSILNLTIYQIINTFKLYQMKEVWIIKLVAILK